MKHKFRAIVTGQFEMTDENEHLMRGVLARMLCSDDGFNVSIEWTDEEGE